MKNVVKLLAFVVIVVGATSVKAGLIANGSFETPTVAFGTYTNFVAGTNIGGWTIVGVDSAVVNSAVQNGITFQAQDGNNWIDLAGVSSNNPNSGVTQNITTQIGADYQLSFFVGSATDNIFFFASTVDLSIDGGMRMSFTNPTTPSNMLNWREFTVPFTAQASSTSITFYNGSAVSNYLSGLDNVSVTAAAVPEPSSMIIAIGMMLSLSIASRRWLK